MTYISTALFMAVALATLDFLCYHTPTTLAFTFTSTHHPSITSTLTSTAKDVSLNHRSETKLSLALGDLPFFAQMQPRAKEGTASITNRLPLGTIFDSRDYIFSTATNVRGYEWTLKEAEELLEDLLDGANGVLGADVSRQDYELSQIVVVPMEWDKELYGLGNRYDVHDGQQRLVTLCLLFASLRDAFAKDGDMADTAKELENMLSPPKVRKADIARIELNKRDNEVLSHILKNDVEGLEKINLKKMTRANKSIHDNFKLLSDRVLAIEKNERVKFLDYLVENVYMLVCIPESSTIARSLVMSQGKGKDNEPIDDFKGLVCFRFVSKFVVVVHVSVIRCLHAIFAISFNIVLTQPFLMTPTLYPSGILPRKRIFIKHLINGMSFLQCQTLIIRLLAERPSPMHAYLEPLLN